MAASSSDSLTPMIRQYLEIKEKHRDAFLFFRMGDFYEMFFEDAVNASKILDIALTARNKNEPNPIPFCGVPHHSASSYIAKLIEKGHKVAICEQVEDPALAKGIVKREVIQIITPGLATDLEALPQKEKNYISCFRMEGPEGAVAFLDLLTGEFKFAPLASPEALIDLYSLTHPQEILYLEADKNSPLFENLKERFPSTLFVPLSGWLFDPVYGEKLIKEQFQVASLAAYGLDETPFAVGPVGAILHYVREHQKVTRLPHLKKLERYEKDSFLWIGEETRRNLEIPLLLDVLDLTLTPMGGRLLREWIGRPLVTVTAINSRLDAVGELRQKRRERETIRQPLASIRDMERVAGKIALGHVSARELVMLRDSCESFQKLKPALSLLSSSLIQEIREKWQDLSPVVGEIGKTLVDEPPLSLKEGGVIRAGFSAELDELREIVHGGKSAVLAMEERERIRTGINSLKIRFNKVFGYYLEITNTHRDKIPPDYTRKQTLTNAERFITPELKEYENKVLSAGERIRGLEYELFLEFREKLIPFVPMIQEQARRVGLLDLLCSLAEVASAYNYARPQFAEEKILRITQGRHPVIERLNSREPFFPNDLFLDGDQNRFLIITGPNMAGKSTIMRQTALIVILAQIGSFVPAEAAQIGIVDRLFTRVGARDDLTRGASTFLVEMEEAAKILHQATERSLILLDEIGRGTSTFDGISIAWAMAEHIHDAVGARTLFATHYHELTDLALTRPGIKNYNVAVHLEGDHILFLRKLVPGGASRSYGIEVAKMAGLPEELLLRAHEVLENLEQEELTEKGTPKLAKKGVVHPKETTHQIALFK
ncbi:MAG: DNA mismatch repair protein MutS [Deltaproteobacteria bacterium]|nr:DNA mismatch repair protein MutS [Deltaproteobacteria bacterium]